MCVEEGHSKGYHVPLLVMVCECPSGWPLRAMASVCKVVYLLSCGFSSLQGLNPSCLEFSFLSVILWRICVVLQPLVIRLSLLLLRLWFFVRLSVVFPNLSLLMLGWRCYMSENNDELKRTYLFQCL